MPRVHVNDVDLSYEIAGNGEPLVLVHGSWAEQSLWQLVVPGLAESFRVVTYDRRGHGRSERPGEGSRRDDEEDLAALIEALGCRPAHVAGVSFGGAITLGLVARRGEWFRTASVHEPPLFDVVRDDAEVQPMMQTVRTSMRAVEAQLDEGDVPGGTQRFMELALGPGAWERLPEEVQETFRNHAATWREEQRDAAGFSLDVGAVARFAGRLLLTDGDQSPLWLIEITRKLVVQLTGAGARAEKRTFAGAGHVPMATHPDDYVTTLTDFVRGSR